MSAEFDPVAVLRALDAHGVQYLVIGGFAAWVQGAAVITMDIDIVYETSEQNIVQLCLALEELEAIYRHQFDRRLKPTKAGLSSVQGAGHHLLATRAGDLDVLRSAAGYTYQELVHDVVQFDIDGIRTPTLALPRVIELKESAGRPKDLAALPTLRAVLEEGGDEGGNGG